MGKRYINWLLLTCPQLGTWPATQACALTGNRTGDPLVDRLALTPLSHANQGVRILSRKRDLFHTSMVVMATLLCTPAKWSNPDP